MGSKSRIAKDIVPIIQDKIDENGITTYIEPFCGGCNIIDKIKCEKKIASDNNTYLIEFFKSRDCLSDLPNIVTKELYNDCRKAYYANDSTNYPQWYIVPGDYKELYIGYENCLFYCDIPYKGTKQYNTSLNFDYDRFWTWANLMSENNIVLVSEYQAPDEWKVIWEKELAKTMNHGNNVTGIEKLFEKGE